MGMEITVHKYGLPNITSLVNVAIDVSLNECVQARSLSTQYSAGNQNETQRRLGARYFFPNDWYVSEQFRWSPFSGVRTTRQFSGTRNTVKF